MRKFQLLPLLAALSMLICTSLRADSGVDALNALAKRIIPSQADRIVFVLEPSGSEYFEFCTKGEILEIRAGNASSLAVGLNNYLRNFCNIDVSWYVRDEIPSLKKLPEVKVPYRRTAVLRDRFFLNYCTYGYSLVWWQWEDWERLIDWMALNGVNMCLAQTGQEAVWQKVWMDMGLSAEQTREYFTGPAFLAWHRMTNIDAWHGPLPQRWIDSQAVLQKKIIEREVSLGIQPIMSSFSGHVPAALKDLYPEADIAAIKPWAGFEGRYQCHYLNPSDSLYGKIQKSFLLTQQEFYGKESHIYGVDPFNEIDPPTWDPSYLASVAEKTYTSIAEVDPDAVWLQMAWLFYFMRDKWTPERVEAYLSPVPKGKLLMLDYFCDKTEVYRRTDNFYGQDFIWSYLGDFGENHMISGSFQDITMKIDRAFADAPEEFKGVGCTLEGLGVDPPVWEFVLDKAWSRNLSDEDYVRQIADCHLGRADESFRKAWDRLYGKCGGHMANDRTMMHELRPGLKLRCKPEKIGYSNDDLLAVWGYVAATKPSSVSQFRFDCTNIARQWLENEFYLSYPELIDAFRNADLERYDAAVSKMTDLLSDIRAICGCDPYFSLGLNLHKARSFGRGMAEKNYYERDARLILSTWGERGSTLVDYSARAYDGLVSSYYAPRWNEFFSRLRMSIQKGEEFDEADFVEWCKDFEWNWATSDRSRFSKRTKSDAFRTSSMLYRKWSEMKAR